MSLPKLFRIEQLVERTRYQTRRRPARDHLYRPEFSVPADGVESALYRSDELTSTLAPFLKGHLSLPGSRRFRWVPPHIQAPSLGSTRPNFPKPGRDRLLPGN